MRRLSGNRVARGRCNRHFHERCHWREYAEDIRALAEGMQDQLTKDVMLRLGGDYDRLAKEIEKRI
jgi:hypothetical protein